MKLFGQMLGWLVLCLVILMGGYGLMNLLIAMMLR